MVEEKQFCQNNCGKSVDDGKEFCSNECHIEYKQDKIKEREQQNM